MKINISVFMSRMIYFVCTKVFTSELVIKDLSKLDLLIYVSVK